MSSEKPFVFKCDTLTEDGEQEFILKLARMLTGTSVIFRKPDKSYMFGVESLWSLREITNGVYELTYKQAQSIRATVDMENVRNTVAFLLGLVECSCSASELTRGGCQETENLSHLYDAAASVGTKAFAATFRK
jgi:hypothetical protein